MKLNGIDEHFEKDPLQSEYANKMKREVENNDPHLAEDRREEYRIIFNMK
jgi:hypothetical protein